MKLTELQAAVQNARRLTDKQLAEWIQKASEAAAYSNPWGFGETERQIANGGHRALLAEQQRRAVEKAMQAANTSRTEDKKAGAKDKAPAGAKPPPSEPSAQPAAEAEPAGSTGSGLVAVGVVGLGVFAAVAAAIVVYDQSQEEKKTPPTSPRSASRREAEGMEMGMEVG